MGGIRGCKSFFKICLIESGSGVDLEVKTKSVWDGGREVGRSGGYLLYF